MAKRHEPLALEGVGDGIQTRVVRPLKTSFYLPLLRRIYDKGSVPSELLVYASFDTIRLV